MQARGGTEEGRSGVREARRRSMRRTRPWMCLTVSGGTWLLLGLTPVIRRPPKGPLEGTPLSKSRKQNLSFFALPAMASSFDLLA